MQLAAGTQLQLIEKAEKELREAENYERKCGSAQTGTPLGDDYQNAQRKTQAARSNLNNVRARYS
jgi:hypothetical protein